MNPPETRQYTALEIASTLELPAPTPEQQAVIEAPLSPALVVAGAGSGKTETMASRVVYLLANRLVGVSEVLGLTFTRKAASELGQRIERRIALLATHGLLPEAHGPLDVPTVSTYNSFANSIFRDNALLVGRESESQVVNEASAWQLARSLVIRSRDPRLAGLNRSVDVITQAVIDLSHALGENVAPVEAVAELADQFLGLSALPSAKGSPYASVNEATTQISALRPLLVLAEAFAAEKAKRGFVEFSDQVALALEVCENEPRVVSEYRDRYRVILLDEYQDTSVVQTRLLARLFVGHGVMAVGDPHQSIYGFRGASAANLGRFPVDFGAAAGASYTLSTSWRNPVRVLEAANTLVAELSEASSVAVGTLAPRPQAPLGSVETLFAETLFDEAAGVAKWFKAALSQRDSAGQLPTAALLFRSKTTLPRFVEALVAEGVPYRVLGVGGLLQRPEIVDLVSCLRVLHDPAAGSELIRIIAGARWRIGVHDIAVLRRVASWLFSHDHGQQKLPDDVSERFRSSVAPGEHGSIVDALDFVGTAPLNHSQLSDFSTEGLGRLRKLAGILAFLRNRTGLDLVDLVALVQQEMLLDIEVAAASGSVRGGIYLQAFEDEMAGYLATDERASLAGFLGWLAAAERRDDMGPRSEEGERGVVQLLTIHGAKGLEWNLVAVPRLVESELPSASRDGKGWLKFGTLPFEFRGDAAELPVLAWRNASDQKEFDTNLKSFLDELATRHSAEERRLAYVAVTRAQDRLLLSGSFWSTQAKPRRPSSYLHELAAAAIIPSDSLREAPAADSNPMSSDRAAFLWPPDPFGPRRPAVEAAAAGVRNPSTDAGRWEREIDLLLREAAENRDRSSLVAIPQRIPASRFKDYVNDPDAVAAALRRPLPERPFTATRLGTLFHSWVEERFRPTGRSETLDTDAFESDFDPDEGPARAGAAPVPIGVDDARRLDSLKATFERSEWAALEPVDVEVEIHLPLGSRTVICKIDAVFERGDHFQIVDWKTGRPPADAADLAAKQLQLALYREAYAASRGIPPERIDAVFYFVADDVLLRPPSISSRAELEALWSQVETAQVSSPQP